MALPQPLVPMQPMLGKPFHRPGWIYEEKYDGWRILAFTDGPRVRLISREAVDHTDRFRELARPSSPLLSPPGPHRAPCGASEDRDEDEQVYRRADRPGLRQAEADTPVGEICRKLGVSEQTFYRWKKRFGALGVTELRELRQLRDENRKLKGLVADLTLDKTILHEALRKMVKPAAGRALVPRTRRRVVAGIMWIVAAVAWLTDPPADRSVSVSVRRCRGMALLSPLGRTEYARGDLHQILLLRFL